MDEETQAWLARHCETVPGAVRAVVVVGAARGAAFRVAACWPAGTAPSSELSAIAGLAARRGRIERRSECPCDGAPLGSSRLGMPLRLPSGAPGAVALEIADAKAAQTPELAERLRAALACLGRSTANPASGERLAAALGLAAVALEGKRFRHAATAVATELATLLGCERVSIGFQLRGHARVEALSHSASFDPRSNLIASIGAAMDEACDQDCSVVHPAPPGCPPRVVRAHEHLVGEYDANAVCTVPIAAGGEVVGAVTFEHADAGRLDAEAIATAEDATALVGPILELKRRADARPLERAREFLGAWRAKLRGPGHLESKLAVGAAALVLLALAFVPGTHRVTADATLEGRVQRAIVAGLDGYVAQAEARAGDLVRKGQILGRLEENELLLERRKWQGRREQHRREYREALAGHDRTQLSILSARLAQAEAQLALLEATLARTRLVAPFDGVIVRGDLTQSLGSPVQKGDVLFQVAPLDGYRIIVKVEETDIADVAVGQHGRLALSALPGRTLPLEVERITPVAIAEDGRNYFRVEARLAQPDESLRPGMEGVAKIDVGRRRLIWLCTHAPADWLRLALWSWWP